MWYNHPFYSNPICGLPSFKVIRTDDYHFNCIEMFSDPYSMLLFFLYCKFYYLFWKTTVDFPTKETKIIAYSFFGPLSDCKMALDIVEIESIEVSEYYMLMWYYMMIIFTSLSITLKLLYHIWHIFICAIKMGFVNVIFSVVMNLSCVTAFIFLTWFIR